MTEAAREELLRGLNEDLAAEYQAILHYLVGAELMTGASRPALRDLFSSELREEVAHAQFLAARIVALGGVPTTTPLPVRLGKGNREQIEIALEAERETLARYRERIAQAEAAGELALKVRLEELLAEETEHRDELDRILQAF